MRSRFPRVKIARQTLKVVRVMKKSGDFENVPREELVAEALDRVLQELNDSDLPEQIDWEKVIEFIMTILELLISLFF